MSNVELIEECINALIDKFQKNPYFFSSERDLQSYLYHLILSKEPFGKEHFTKNGYSIGLVHADYPAISGGRFDLVVLDRRLISQRTLKNQRILCGIEIGLNQSYEHFEKDCGVKFVKEAKNDVSIGYILHFVWGFHKDWNMLAQFGHELAQQINVKEEIKQRDFFLLKLIESNEVNVLAVKIIVENEA